MNAAASPLPNMLERLNEEIRRRTYVGRIFVNSPSCLRLVKTLAVETNGNWTNRYIKWTICATTRNYVCAKPHDHRDGRPSLRYSTHITYPRFISVDLPWAIWATMEKSRMQSRDAHAARFRRAASGGNAYGAKTVLAVIKW